ncbi:hypothetical protein Tco_1128282 [Tanacetum coccineum]
MNEITDLHQIREEVLLTERGDDITSIKRRRRDLFNDDVWNLETASGRDRLKEDLESSTHEGFIGIPTESPLGNNVVPLWIDILEDPFHMGEENETEEESSVEPNKTGYTNREEADDTDEEVESKKEVEEETEGEPEEEEEDDPKHFDTFPTMKELRIVYNKEEGTVVFESDKKKIMFKMPHKMDMFKHIDFADIITDRIPSFIVESDDDNCEKTHYSDSLDLGPEYKYDKYVCRGIRSLMAAKARRKNKGEVT